MVISVYEVIHVFALGADPNDAFPVWANRLIVLNTLLVVLNSSVNFAFYCGDAVFRECLAALAAAGKHEEGAESNNNDGSGEGRNGNGSGVPGGERRLMVDVTQKESMV